MNNLCAFLNQKPLDLKAPLKGGWKVLGERPGGWILLESEEGLRIKTAFVSSGQSWSAQLGGVSFFGTFGFLGRALEKGLKMEESLAEPFLFAPFPGRCLTCLVKPQDFVKAGQPLLTLESMKMEFTLSANFDQQVKSVNIEPGQFIKLGDLLIEWVTEK